MKPLIVALDVETEKEAMDLVRWTKKHVDIYKVGPGLILRYGPSLIKKIARTRHKVFLDMKFHDIPATMMRSIKEAGRAGAFSATVHTAAGPTALKSVSAIKGRPEIWGVTVLTSLSDTDLNDLGISRTVFEQVKSLAEMARFCGLDGIVASVGETTQLRSLLGPKFRIITPGIRLPEDAAGDQKRIATPQHARSAGATFFVVGRPLTESRDPAFVAEAMMKDWHKGFKNN